MKAGKTNIDMNARVVIVETENPGLLGMTGYVMQPSTYDKNTIAGIYLEKDQGGRIDLHVGDKIIEIQEDDGMTMAGTTNIPVNERIKVISSPDSDIIGMIGYITHPFSGLLAPGVKYAAGIRIEYPQGIFNGDICNLTDEDRIIRFPEEK